MKQRLLVTALSAGLLFGCNNVASQDPAASDESASRSAALPSASKTETAELAEDILLTVNDQPVTKHMYGLYFQDRTRNNPDAKSSQETQMSVLNELANVLIVAQDAEKQNIHLRPEVEATLALLRAKLLTQTAIQEFANANKPSDEQIQSVYDADYAGKTGKEFKARHILVKEEEQAKSLITELDGGADFATLAAEHSTGPTGKKGGDLGWFEATQMVKPFADAVQTLEAGNYTKEPVQTQFGWHVILLEESRESAAPSLDSVKNEIATKLQQESLTNYMKGLRDKSTLKFNEKSGIKKREDS